MKAFINCPVCPALHEIVEIKVERACGEAQHIARVHCEAAGRNVEAVLEVLREAPQ